MLSAADSFVEYLYRELSPTIPVVWRRTSADDAFSHRLKDNALNIDFLDFPQHGSLEEILVSLDILGSNDRTVFGWSEIVRDKLLETQFIPELNYEPDPNAPTPTGKLVSWDRDDIRFGVIARDEHYVHVNCTLSIRHAR